MSFIDWIHESKQAINQNGIKSGVQESTRKFHYGALRNIEQTLANSGVNVGKNVFDQDWDVLVIVDGCRYDLMEETASEHEFLSRPKEFASLAGGSLSWMRRTFTTDRDFSDIAYVTANPFSSHVLRKQDFAVLDEVWRYAWDDGLGTVRAESVTEAAVDTLRQHAPNRAVVHYMQPHHPFVPDPLAAGINREDPTDHNKTAWEKLRDNQLDRDTVWAGYRANLEYVLDSVDMLRQNVFGPKMVVTADHGNALGEWGIYGHGDYPIPALRRVPWCTATSADNHTIEPSVDRDYLEVEIEEQLRDLGYQ